MNEHDEHLPRPWRWYVSSLRAIAVVLLTAVILIGLANVASRYLQFGTITWADEMARRLLVYMTFIGSALAVIGRSHLRIDTLQERVRDRPRMILEVFVGIVGATFLVILLVGGGSQTLAVADRTTPGMAVSAAWTNGAVPVGAFLMLVSLVGRWWTARGAPTSEPDLPPDGIDASRTVV